MLKRRRRALRPLWDFLDEKCLPSGYTPAQITSAYGLDAISLTSSSGAKVIGDGTGQTIALIETYHDPNIQASLDAFDGQYGLPHLTLTVIDQAGSQTDAGWAREESLDVEWAHAIAPGAKIVLVEASPGNADDQGLSALIAAIKTAVAWPGVSAVSMSWGMDEFPDETAYDSDFTAPGVTFIASSGDSGTVEWPSSSPDVLAVGGTSLTVSGSGAYVSETGWNGAGGGLTVNEPEPSYQDVVQSKGARSTPDISFVADPNTGVAVYVIPPDSSTGQGKWEVVGGTSLSAPAWAGIIAIADQGLAISGHPNLTGATQVLPELYSAPSSAFHEVALSGQTGSGTTNTQISTPDYNTQTGLGTPNGASLISVFAPGTTSPTPTPTPTPAPTPTPTPTPTPILIPTPTPPPIGLPVPTPTPSPIPTPTPVPTRTPIASPPPAAPPTRVLAPHKRHVVAKKVSGHKRSAGQGSVKKKGHAESELPGYMKL